jgi:hypothetical protein
MALHAKAKESPDLRFYALYDKVYRKDVLVNAYQRCKSYGGAAGVDNQTLAICTHPPEKVKVAMPTAYQSNRRVVGLCCSMRKMERPESVLEDCFCST